MNIHEEREVIKKILLEHETDYEHKHDPGTGTDHDEQPIPYVDPNQEPEPEETHSMTVHEVLKVLNAMKPMDEVKVAITQDGLLKNIANITSIKKEMKTWDVKKAAHNPARVLIYI